MYTWFDEVAGQKLSKTKFDGSKMDLDTFIKVVELNLQTEKTLRDIGSKTVHTIWDESYDMIEDPKERMTAIIDLVLELNSRKDFREMIDSCRDIVDHNYKMLQMRRPENKMISALL